MTASGDVTHVDETLAPKPGLFKTFALMLAALLAGVVGWTLFVAFITLMVRYCAFIAHLVWNIGR